ncbi:deoxycytidyl transferase [Entophlyctis sp. JEL0112]|nr:deoxycytidyl transferase [Entophlyctis sp. JEL0112]
MAYDGMRDYMAAKLQKQQHQNGEYGTAALSRVLEPTILWFDGFLGPEHSMLDMKTLCVRHGATVVDVLTLSVTHIIAVHLTARKLELWKNRRVVDPQWLHESIKAGRLLPWQRFGIVQRTSASLFNTAALAPTKEQAPQQLLPHQSTSTHNIHKAHAGQSWKAKNSATAEGFLEKYYSSSRLSKISNWKADLKDFVAELEMTYPKPERPSKAASSSKRTIMHVDMDCFFASVALRNRPELRSLPVAVCHSKGIAGGSTAMHYGLGEESFSSTSEIASCNYVARSFGVRNGMLLGKAQKLVATSAAMGNTTAGKASPSSATRLITLPYQFDAYDEVSKILYRLLHKTSDSLMVVSCDEAYIDVSSQVIERGTGKEMEIAEALRAQIFEQSQGCCASIGIGENMFLARVATKRAKPDGVFALLGSTEDIQKELFTMNVHDLPGVGYVIAKQMNDINIHTCRDLARLSLSACKKHFGDANGSKLYQFARGIDTRPFENKSRQSVGVEVNWGIRFQALSEVHTFLSQLVQELLVRLAKTRMMGRQITLKVKKKLYEGEPTKLLGCGHCLDLSKTRPIAPEISDLKGTLLKDVLELYQELGVSPDDLRGVGIHMSKLADTNGTSSVGLKGQTLLKFGFSSKINDAEAKADHREMYVPDNGQKGAKHEVPSVSGVHFQPQPSSSQIDWGIVELLPKEIQLELRSLKRKSSSTTSATRGLEKRVEKLDAPSGKNARRSPPPSFCGETSFSGIARLFAAWVKSSDGPALSSDVEKVCSYLRALVRCCQGDKCARLLRELARLAAEDSRERKGKGRAGSAVAAGYTTWTDAVKSIVDACNAEFMCEYGAPLKLSGLDPDGFARPTVVSRWPVIVTDAVNAVLAEALAADTDAPSRDPGPVVALLSQLKYEIARDKPLSPIPAVVADALDNFSPDYWNAAVRAHFPHASFFTASWLFAECFLYARIHAAVNSQPEWAGFDVFLRGKTAAFKDSGAKVAAITGESSTLWHSLAKPGQESHEALVANAHAMAATPSGFKTHLRELLLLSLWGNATDLSMFAGLSEEQVQKMHSEASGEANIVSNHIPEILDYFDSAFPTPSADVGASFAPISHADGGRRRVDFVLDNSGFELFSDILLADYLHQTGRVQKTVFHCKPIPWFVSDTLPSDFDWLLSALAGPTEFFDAPFTAKQEACAKALQARCRGYIDSGAWVITSDPIWCTFWAHEHIHQEAPHIYGEWMQESGAVIFKGDLNYRKLVYDCRFPATTPFRTAIGSIAQLPAVISLRTNKSDPIVGLAQGVEERLLSTGHNDWRWSGKFAVVEFCQASNSV